MSEVTYEYVKGQGWVPFTKRPFPCRNGTSYYLELRKPEPGEFCCWSDEDWSLERWAEWIKGATPYAYRTLCNSLSRSNIYWCTFVEVV